MKHLFAIPFVSALIGGGVVVAVIAAAGGLGATQKTVTQIQASSPVASSATSSPVAGTTKSSGLSAHEIYERTAPSVAYVTSTIVRQSESPFGLGGETQQQGTATGSGFAINANGTILTNWHVVENAVKVTVHSLTLGNSGAVEVGEPVLAIGNPFGLSRTLTTGVISALQRKLEAPNGFTIDNVLQTDAPINPGNSGGPLLNAAGEVIGINSQIETGGSGDGNIGIGFAVPINTAKSELPELEKGGTIRGAYLGVSTLTVDGALSSLNLPVKSGALVEKVEAGSAADKAGIRAGNIEAKINGSEISVGGDIIVGFDGKQVTSAEDLASMVGAKKPGDAVTIELLRASGNGTYGKKTVTATLGQRPNSNPNSTTNSGNPNTPE
jgi:S1-C subfamily serine protease